jgi:hypothetical protein
MEAEKLYSVPDAAKFLGGISPWTIHAWLSKGKLQRTKIGSRTMVRESELLKIVKDGGKSPKPHKAESHAEGTRPRLAERN